MRVRFAIASLEDGRFFAVLSPTRGSTKAPANVFTGGRILSEWRAAERRLTEVSPGSEEATRIEAEIERLRAHYQDLFRR